MTWKRWKFLVYKGIKSKTINLGQLSGRNHSKHSLPFALRAGPLWSDRSKWPWMGAGGFGLSDPARKRPTLTHTQLFCLHSPSLCYLMAAFHPKWYKKSHAFRTTSFSQNVHAQFVTLGETHTSADTFSCSIFKRQVLHTLRKKCRVLSPAPKIFSHFVSKISFLFL